MSQKDMLLGALVGEPACRTNRRWRRLSTLFVLARQRAFFFTKHARADENELVKIIIQDGDEYA